MTEQPPPYPPSPGQPGVPARDERAQQSPEPQWEPFAVPGPKGDEIMWRLPTQEFRDGKQVYHYRRDNPHIPPLEHGFGPTGHRSEQQGVTPAEPAIEKPRGPNPFASQVFDEGIATDPDGHVVGGVVHSQRDPAQDSGFRERQRKKFGLQESPVEVPEEEGPQVVWRDDEFGIAAAPSSIGASPPANTPRPRFLQRATPTSSPEDEYERDAFGRRVNQDPINRFPETQEPDQPS